MIEAFDSGWRAGASLGGAHLQHFADAGPDLHMFWLDGFYAAQAGIGADGLIVDEANDDRGTAAPSEDHKTAEHRLSHPITRALHAAYQTGEAPSVDSLAAMLARLDLIR